MANQLQTRSAGAMQAVGSVLAQPVDRIEALVETFGHLKAIANLLTPITQITHIKEMHQVSFRAVVVDPGVDNYGNGGECYKGFFHKENERALGKVALMNIMAAAGIQHVYKKDIADGRETPYFWKVEFCLAVQDFDGLWRQVIESKEYDLRDGAAETLTPKRDASGKIVKDDSGSTVMVPIDANRLNEMRKHGYRRCESCALEATVRAILSLKQKYTVDELAKPFVVPKLVFVPDMSDPTVRKMVVAQGLSGANQLYGHDQNARLLQVGGEIDSSPSPPASESPPPSARPSVVDVDVPAVTGGYEPLDEPTKIIECGCPCEHLAAMSAEDAAASVELVGSCRCPECFPGEHFNYKKHEDLPTLELKNYPDYTPAKAKERAEKLRKKTQAA